MRVCWWTNEADNHPKGWRIPTQPFLDSAGVVTHKTNLFLHPAFVNVYYLRLLVLTVLVLK